MRSENTYQSARALLALLLALVLVVAACGADGDDSGDSGGDAADSADDFERLSYDDGDVAADDSADDEGDGVAESGIDDDAASADSEVSLGAGGATGTLNAADLGRKLIFTASLNVGVDDVAASSAEATSIIEGLGGFLFGQGTEGGVNARSELTFKVLPEDFNVALERLGSVGELRNQTVTTDDVAGVLVPGSEARSEDRVQVGSSRVEAARGSGGLGGPGVCLRTGGRLRVGVGT